MKILLNNNPIRMDDNNRAAKPPTNSPVAAPEFLIKEGAITESSPFRNKTPRISNSKNGMMFLARIMLLEKASCFLQN
ncbi:hypothetical protein HZA43_03160 [Candidatus Peregrinibacteria bacterium]|nr:hypothetical protein [Candidatus Peregrinibacteria bacterium]